MKSNRSIDRQQLLPEPKVSVIMAAYNAAAFISKAISSVRKQTISAWELIIVDDCSTDSTEEIVRSFAEFDGRIKYLRAQKNGGPGAARNLGFSNAKGEWITVLDSDDQYAPNRLQLLIANAESAQAQIVADNQHCFDEGANRISHRAFDMEAQRFILTASRLVKNDGPPRTFSLGLLKPFILRTFWLKTGVTYPENYRVGEDFIFLFSLIMKGGKAVVIRDAGYIYTLPFGHISRQSSSTSQTDYALETIIKCNDIILAAVISESPTDTELTSLLRKRKKRFVRAKAWQKLQTAFRNRTPSQTAKAISSGHWLPHIFGRAMNKVMVGETLRP